MKRPDIRQRGLTRKMRAAARDTITAIYTGQAEEAVIAHQEFIALRAELWASGIYPVTCIEAAS